MSELKTRNLGQLIQIRKGKKPGLISSRQQNEAQKPYLLIDSFGGEYKSFTDDASCPYAKENETLLVWDGERCGLASTGHEGYVGSTLAAIKCATEDLQPNYLFHFLASKQKEIRNSAEGTGVPHVSRRFIEDLQMVLPPLPEQKKIAEILSGIDELIHAEERKISKIVETKTEMSRDLFSSFMSTERERGAHAQDGIAIMPLESVCESVIDCKNRTPPYTEGGHPVVRTPNVRNGKLVETDLRYTDPSSYKIWTARAIPRPMDVLFTREAPLGEVCLVPENFKCCLGQRMMLFRADKSLIDPQYLLFSLMSPFVQGQLLKNKGGTTVGHARVADIRNLPIPVFPKEKQVKIATAFSSIEECLERIVRKKRKLEFQKTAIASDLLSGRKRVSV